MKKKSILVSLIMVVIFSIFFSYSLVFWVDAFFWNEISINFKLSNNIYPDSLYLKSSIIAFKSNTDLSNYTLNSSCNIFSKLVSKNTNLYLFELKFLDNKCTQKYFYFENESGEKTENIYYNVLSEYKLYSEFLDYKTSKLENLEKLLDKKRLILLDYNEFNKNWNIRYYNFLKNNRSLNEVIYNINLINKILSWRKDRYSIPIVWKDLPTNPVKIPNSPRPYRSDYTDWIHHGWDFDADFWEQVIAIDDGIIVRVVSGFNYKDLLNIVKWKNLTYEEKLKNLDILGWNQVWLKTMKWDVAFYSHLSDIYTNIKEWTVVKKWQPIWSVWISWVPDKSYTDYHLHLPIHKNPYYENMIWKYDIDDYMKWDWYFKWQTSDYVLNNQNSVFK